MQNQPTWTALDSPGQALDERECARFNWLKTSPSFVLWAKGWWEAVPKKIDMLNLNVILPASSLDTMYT